MMNIKKILLPVDFPLASLDVIYQAATLARHFHSEIVILHVETAQSHAAGVPDDNRGLAEWDLLAAIIRQAPNQQDPASHRRVDDANGAQRDGRGLRVSTPTSVRASRPRHEVRRGIPGDAGRRRGGVPATPSAEPERECFCGTLSAIGQRGVPIQADPVRGSFLEESANPIPGALPRRKKSSGQRQ